MQQEIYNRFLNLTLLDLEEWTDKKTLQRGQSYYKSNSVSNVQSTEDGIIGDVEGTIEYTTYVNFKKNGKKKQYSINGACSCPVEIDCKHCVALVLKYLEMVKAKKKIKEINLEDDRFEKIRNPTSFDDEDDFDDEYGYESDSYVGGYDDSFYFSKNQKKEKSTSKDEIIDNLEKLDKKALLSLIKENMEKNSELKETLNHKILLSGKNPSKILTSIKKEINKLYMEVEYNDDLNFDKIKDSLNFLVDNETNSIPEIMKQLVELGNHAMNYVDEIFYGEEALVECLEIGMKGIEKIDWQNDKKILFCLELKKANDYSYTETLFNKIYSNAGKDAWSKVADSLLTKVDKIKSLPKENNQKINFSTKYGYENLVKDTILALNNANRKKEVLQLLRKEASITEDYHNLIEALMNQKEYGEVKKISLEQLKSSDGSLYLISKLKDIASIEKDNEYLLKILMWKYLNRPNLDEYKELKKLSTRLKKWKQVQEWILSYLETGNKLFGKENPEDYIQVKKEKYPFGNKFPDFREIIEIYIYENDPHKIWDWYNRAIKAHKELRSGFQALPEDKIAQMIREIRPNESIAIWKFLAEKSIGHANKNGYSDALPLLKRARDLLLKNGKNKEWEAYYQDLKLRNKNRPRCIEELAKLSGKKIVE
jgi:uncharacterized Zn finger protein